MNWRVDLPHSDIEAMNGSSVETTLHFGVDTPPGIGLFVECIT